MATFLSKVDAFRQISAKNFTNIMDSIPSPKDFIIDFALIKPLEKIVNVSVLKKHGVEKIYKFDVAPAPTTNTQVVYMIASDLINTKYVIDQVNSQNQKSERVKVSYYLILVPRKFNSIMKLIEEEGIHEHIKVFSFPWELIRLDSTLLSLEFPNIFKSVFVENNLSFLPVIARSIWSTMLLFGTPMVTICIGRIAKQVDVIVEEYLENLGKPDSNSTDISYCIIMDRDIDYPTALLTSGTYTSLLDEVFSIKSGMISVPGTKINFGLSNQDETFSQIKYRHFCDVSTYLSNKAKLLQEEYTKSQSMGLQEIKTYISKNLENVRSLKQSLGNHVTACEAVSRKIGSRFAKQHEIEQNILANREKKETIQFIENRLAYGEDDKAVALRLMCLLSISQDGLYADEAKTLKTQFLQTYGYHHLPVFHSLEQCGLFVEQPSLMNVMAAESGTIANKLTQVVTARRGTFQTLAQKLTLIPNFIEDLDLKNPKDMSYVFSGGYVPVACQLVHLIWKKELSLDELQKIFPNSYIKNKKNIGSITASRNKILVYLIGGVTYAEMAAFKFLETSLNVQILVASTSTINGNIIIEQCS